MNAKVKRISTYSRAAPSNAPVTSTHYEVYKGEELKRNPGIPDERFTAFNLPSIVAGQRIYPKRKA